MDIKDLQVKVESYKGQMQDLINTAAKEQRELNTAEGTKFDNLNGELETTKRNIDRLVALRGLDKTLNGNPNAQIAPQSDLGAGLGDNPLDVPEKDLRKYSMLRAVQRMLDNKPVDGLEGEISREIEKRTGSSAKGFYMYGSATSAIEARQARQMQERRDLTLTTGVGGLNQTVMFQSFIEILRNKTLVDKVGTTFMSGLVGKFYIPRQSGAGTAYWVGEETALTASNQTIDQVTLAANTLGAYTIVDRQFIKQTSLDAEMFVRNDLAAIMGLEIDRVAFNGSGSSNQPTGILQNGSVTINTGSNDSGNGGALAWSDLVGLETSVAAANADLGALSYVTNTKQRGKLKTVLKSSVAGATYIWDDGEINGYPAFAGNNIPSNLTKGTGTNLSPVIFGNFQSLIVGLWGGLDILVDPYSAGTAGSVKIIALQDIDVELRHPLSFAAITAATN